MLDLCRGPLLEGLKLSDAPDYELWLTAERDRLGQLYLAGANRLLAEHRKAADWQAILSVAQRALAFDNGQESMHAALMEALARLGQRSHALRQYDTLRTILEQELGITPLPGTQALRTQILSGELAVAGSPVFDAQTRPQSTPRIGMQRQLSRPFVGRQVERTALDEARELAAGDQITT